MEPVIVLSLAADFTFITKALQSDWKTTCWKPNSRVRVTAQLKARTPATSRVVMPEIDIFSYALHMKALYASWY
jgi:hypothetical protein